MGQTASKSLFDLELPPWHQVPHSQTDTRTATHVTDATTDYKPHMTLYTNLMERRAVDDGSRPIFGWRIIDKTTKQVGDYKWVTYAQFLDHVTIVSSAMKHELGLQRQEPVGLFAKNRYEWVQVEHAASRMAYTLVPLYDTLGPNAVPFILNHTEMRVVFFAKEQFGILLQSLDKAPTVKIVVQFEPVSDEQRALVAAKGVELKDWTQLLENGKLKPVDAEPPLPEDNATICYTSGTTGDPKGAVLSHANMISAAYGTSVSNQLYADDVHLSYLPLPHVLERALQNVLIHAGGSIGFYQGDVAKMLDDLATLKPTIFLSVPRVLNRIHDKIAQGVEAAGGVKKALFDYAFDAKKYYLTQGYVTHGLWDRLVFRKAQQVVGGRMRLMMNASAPISKDCKEFLQIVFACPVTEGYGLTESAGPALLSTAAQGAGNHIGFPIPQLEVCLVDVPELNYTSKDTPAPRGEVCLRGPNIFKGYYKDAAKTAEAIDQDGWFHTGDIGKWNEDGTLSIIDRKKNIFKLSQGEYVAPEKIENVYLKSPLIAQIFVHGNSLQNFVVAIVVPDKEITTEWAKTQPSHIASIADDFSALCRSEELQAAIKKSMADVGVTFGLIGFERVQRLHLHDELWTVENNKVTPTFKLKRPELVKNYASEIDRLYAAAAH